MEHRPQHSREIPHLVDLLQLLGIFSSFSDFCHCARCRVRLIKQKYPRSLDRSLAHTTLSTAKTNQRR